jgi:hypothetical protein
MPLSVPLSVRVDQQHITPQVAAVKFKKNAIGGVESISLRLARQLDQLTAEVAGFTRVYVYDSRNAVTLAEGRITDTGRSVDASSGQQWDVTAFGPAQHTRDQTFPYVIVDTRVDQWLRSVDCTKNATTAIDERTEDIPSLVISAEEGKTVATTWAGYMVYRNIRRAGMKLARVRATIDSGQTNANFQLGLITDTDGGAKTAAAFATADTAGATLAGVVVTDFTNGHNQVQCRVARTGGATTGLETTWYEFYSIAIRALLLDKSGAEVTTGYTASTVLASEVVADLLGRKLDQFDGANAAIATTANTIDQLAYDDGVTAEQVLTDLMVFEPGYRWTTGPSTSSGGYAFKWEAWPGLRYEVTLNDGGSFPVSMSDLFNEVTVRWQPRTGGTRTTTVTGDCPILTAASVTRRAMIDLADEVGSSAAATQAGTNFLLDHKYPTNTGQIRVNRPILDLNTNSMVSPQEIEPGYLIRVRGLESYGDALNASDNDGLTVFRIWTMEYDSDSDSAVLELDTYSRTVANQVAGLIKKRTRKR